MQLDTEEGETFVPPAGVVAASNVEHSTAVQEGVNDQDPNESEAGAAEN
jgi:hypothetical protein